MRVGEVVSLEREMSMRPHSASASSPLTSRAAAGHVTVALFLSPPWLMQIVLQTLPLDGRLLPDIAEDGLRSAMQDTCRKEGRTLPERDRRPGRSLETFTTFETYTHMIVPEDIDQYAVERVLTDSADAADHAAGGAPVMHELTP